MSPLSTNILAAAAWILYISSGVSANFFTRPNNRPMDGPGAIGNINRFGPADRLTNTRMSMGVLNITSCNTLHPHTHTNVDEGEYVVRGSGIAGVILPNATAVLFPFEAGDLMMFPNGMMHFQYASDPDEDVLLVSVLNNQNPNFQIMAAMGILPEDLVQPGTPFGGTPREQIAVTLGLTLEQVEDIFPTSSRRSASAEPRQARRSYSENAGLPEDSGTEGLLLPIEECLSARAENREPNYDSWNLVDGVEAGFVVKTDSIQAYRHGSDQSEHIATQRPAVASFLGTGFGSNRLIDGEGFLQNVAGEDSNVPFFEGTSLSSEIIEVPAPCGYLPSHMHPNADELAFVFEGTGFAGHIATNGTTFYYKINRGDYFLIPEGLPHFIVNEDEAETPLKLYVTHNNQHFSQQNTGDVIAALPTQMLESVFTAFGSSASGNVFADIYDSSRAKQRAATQLENDSCKSAAASFKDGVLVDGHAMGYLSTLDVFVENSVAGVALKTASFSDLSE